MIKNNIKRIDGRFILLLIGSFCFLNLNAQYIDQYPISSSNGDKMLDIKNYQEAVRQFTALLGQEPENVTYKFKLGKSYIHSYIDKRKGLELLKKIGELNEKPDGFQEQLAIAYFKNYEFDTAKEIFLQLQNQADDSEEEKKYKDWVEQAQRSKKMSEEPVWVKFENLGKNVNSESPDYLPVTEPDESSIYFTTRREGVVGNLFDYGGYRTADIYVVKHKRNKYSRSRSVGNPNTYGNEQTAGRSENGNYMVYNINSEDHFNDLFVSEKGRRSYMPPKVFDSEEVNQKTNEMGGTLTNDGETFYFCSDRDGGQGGFDLYLVRRLPNGKWGLPKNIGPPINTSGDEMYPNLMDDGKTLYFASNGHPGMGGMDLFKSKRDEGSGNWMEIENLGHPVNTPDDDLNISFAANKRYAYMAAKRDDSYGDLDIYRLTFLNEKDDFTLLSGRILNSDSSQLSVDVLVEVFDLAEEKLYGSYLMSKKTGKYSAILPVGEYRIEVLNTFGYQDFSTEIKLLGKNDFQAYKKLDIVLKQSD